MKNMSQILSKLEKLLLLNGFDLNDDQKRKIECFVELLMKWNQTINLTAHRTVEDVLEKDILDNLYLVKGIDEQEVVFNSCIDLGCGAGFSGIVLHILKNNIKIKYLDSDRKKINFIKQVYRELKLGLSRFLSPSEGVLLPNTCGEKPFIDTSPLAAEFLIQRVEEGIKEEEKVDISITRATWALADYLKYAHYYVQNSGIIISMAGKKNDTQHIDNKEEFEVSTINYTIKPQNYERALLFFKKIK